MDIAEVERVLPSIGSAQAQAEVAAGEGMTGVGHSTAGGDAGPSRPREAEERALDTREAETSAALHGQPSLTQSFAPAVVSVDAHPKRRGLKMPKIRALSESKHTDETSRDVSPDTSASFEHHHQHRHPLNALRAHRPRMPRSLHFPRPERSRSASVSRPDRAHLPSHRPASSFIDTFKFISGDASRRPMSSVEPVQSPTSLFPSTIPADLNDAASTHSSVASVDSRGTFDGYVRPRSYAGMGDRLARAAAQVGVEMKGIQDAAVRVRRAGSRSPVRDGRRQSYFGDAAATDDRRTPAARAARQLRKLGGGAARRLGQLGKGDVDKDSDSARGTGMAGAGGMAEAAAALDVAGDDLWSRRRSNSMPAGRPLMLSSQRDSMPSMSTSAARPKGPRKISLSASTAWERDHNVQPAHKHGHPTDEWETLDWSSDLPAASFVAHQPSSPTADPPKVVKDALLGAGLLVAGLYGSAYGAYRRRREGMEERGRGRS